MIVSMRCYNLENVLDIFIRLLDVGFFEIPKHQMKRGFLSEKWLLNFIMKICRKKNIRKENQKEGAPCYNTCVTGS